MQKPSRKKSHQKPTPLSPLERRMRGRVLSPEQWASAFGETKKPGPPEGMVGVRCLMVAETAKALLIEHVGVGQVWVPKSLCEFHDSLGLLHVEEWFARKEGLI